MHMHPSGHVDSFARDNLPPPHLWPVIDAHGLNDLAYPERLNCAATLIDDALAAGHGARPAIHFADGAWSYAELADRVDRLAHVLVADMGVVSGNRVLLRGGGGPMMAAAWLAVVKAGAIAVATMPLLRARELAVIVDKAEIDFCLYEKALGDEVYAIADHAARPLVRRSFGDPAADDAVEPLMARHGAPFPAADTADDDVCLIAFTSGTTGKPKGTMHFHRDVLAICDCFPRYVLRPTADDVFIGSPPLAFTFGLGGLLLFPMRAFAATVLLPRTPQPS
ncbi:MAG: AMP-binding protein [Alphaproteobacteria bacterium]